MARPKKNKDEVVEIKDEVVEELIEKKGEEVKKPKSVKPLENGSKVKVKGFIHKTSFDTKEETKVDGIFEVVRVIKGKTNGVFLKGTGWAREQDCVVMQNGK